MNYKTKKPKTKGFTLIELLVVIAIIGLIASIVLVSLNTVRQKARNTRRNGDIKQLALAFNMAANDNGGNLVSSSNWVCISTACYGAWNIFTANSTVDSFFAPYAAKPEYLYVSSLGRGGYLYHSAWTGGTSPSTGQVFPAGAYLNWIIEPGGSCAPGHIWYTPTNYTQCLLPLD